MTSSNYANLKIVNWDLVKKINLRDFRLSKDTKTIQKLIINFLNSSSLFADPSFCPPDLVIKYFNLIQISVRQMVNHIHELDQKIEDQNHEIRKLKNEQKKTKSKVPKYNLPPVVFQCVFCSKLFKTRTYLNNHIKRRHPEHKYPITQDQPINNEPRIEHTIKTVTNVPETSLDLGPFKAEANAILNHFDTILKNEQSNIRADFREKFRQIDKMVQETLERVQNERLNTIKRVKELEDASYSDEEAMNERLQATDNSEETHGYSQHDGHNSEYEEEIESSDSNDDTYTSYHFDEEIKQNTHNFRNSENESTASRSDHHRNNPEITPTSPTATSAMTSTPTNNYYTQESSYYNYSDYNDS